MGGETKRGDDHTGYGNRGRKGGGVRLHRDHHGHQDESPRIFPKTANGTESLASSQGLPCPSHPNLKSPSPQVITEGQILTTPPSILTRGPQCKIGTDRGPLPSPKRDPSLPLCLSLKPALAGKGQNPEETENRLQMLWTIFFFHFTQNTKWRIISKSLQISKHKGLST